MDYGMQMVELEKLFSNKIQKIVSNHYKNQFYCWNKRKRILIQEAFYFCHFFYFQKCDQIDLYAPNPNGEKGSVGL